MQSYLFDFSRVPTFFENFNINFNVSDMYQYVRKDEFEEGEDPFELISEGSDTAFELVIASSSYNNIGACLNNDGTLNTDVVTVIDTATCGLDWRKYDYGDVTVDLHDEVVFDIGDTNVVLKAVFLRDATTGFVMGYSIQQQVFTVTNKVVFDDDVIFWDISRFSNGG